MKNVPTTNLYTQSILPIYMFLPVLDHLQISMISVLLYLKTFSFLLDFELTINRFCVKEIHTTSKEIPWTGH